MIERGLNVVYYKTNIKNLKAYQHDYFWYSCKAHIILAALCIPICILLFVIGYYCNKNLFIGAYCILALFVFLVLVLIRLFFLYKKHLEILFKKVDSNGEIESKMHIENDDIVIENDTHKTTLKINVNEIKSVTVTKNIILVKTILRQIWIFPKTNEIIDYFRKNSIIS